jgi:hypothetical protein
MMSLKKVSDRMTPSLQRIKKDLGTVPKQAHSFFVRSTPRRSGNARSKTRLSNDTILAQYPYARRLDQGYSKQAPRGMVRPTLDFLRKLLRNMIRK